MVRVHVSEVVLSMEIRCHADAKPFVLQVTRHRHAGDSTRWIYNLMQYHIEPRTDASGGGDYAEALSEGIVKQAMVGAMVLSGASLASALEALSRTNAFWPTD